MRLLPMLPMLLTASGIFASAAAAAAESAALKTPTTTTGLRAKTNSNQHARRTNRYWVAPVRNAGLTCIDNSIRAGGGKPNEICMTEGEALCIEYDYKPMGGRWQFGIKDSKLRLYNPKQEVVYEYCKAVTHLCIGEEHGFDPNRYSKERPYLTLYDEKIHEVVGSLTCDGTDGKDDENIGQSSILKLVDQADVGPYADYPLTLVKFKKGQTEDPNDENSLWDITVTEPVATATGLQLESFLNYNADRCEWNSYVDSFEDLKRQIAAATDSDPDNRAKIEICEDRPIVFDSVIDFSNKYFELSCLGTGCVFDLNGFSLVTRNGGSAFYAEFEGITLENGSSFEGRDSQLYSNQWGGAFYLRGLSPAESVLTLKDCVLQNNVAYDSGAIESREASIVAEDTTFIDNEVENIGGAIFSVLGALSFKGCQFVKNNALVDGGVLRSFSDDVSFEDCTFDGNSAGLWGGVVASSTSTVSFRECRFKRNSAAYVGGVAAAFFSSTHSFQGCHFESNWSDEFAGVAYTSSSSTSSFESCIFEENYAGIDAGVIYSYGVSLFSSCRFERNDAGDDGGVIYHFGDSSFENCYFEANSAADDAGVVYTRPSGTATFTSCEFVDNRATDDGGVAYTRGTSSFEDCHFDGNIATDDGGVVNVPIPFPGEILGSFSIKSCNFVGNRATEYGGVASYAGTATFEDSSFEGNRAGIDGGVLYTELSASSTFNNSQFNSNTARDGGAFLIGGTAIVENCKFGRNAASRDSGAIELRRDSSYSFVNTTFSANTAVETGGALRQNRRAISSFHECSFEGNSADIGGALFILRNARADFEVSKFERNHAASGGALFAERQSLLNLEGSNFIGNSATDTGGAIMSLDSTTNIRACEFIGNSADIDGGAIFLEGAERTSTFDSCQFNGNRAVDGGAILLHNNAMASINGCGFQDNFAFFFGGAIFTVDAETSIKNGTTFSCNEALGGGAIWNEGGNIDIANVGFTNNVAVGGGGLVVESANSTVTDSLFDQNVAVAAGGGATAYLSYFVTPINTVNGTVFQNNTSLDASLPSDDILDVNAVFNINASVTPPQDIRCGLDSDNCFCDADFNDIPDISTNDLPSTCSGAGVGTGPSPCSGCLPTLPSTCSAFTRAGTRAKSDEMSFQEMGNMIDEKMKSMEESMKAMKEMMTMTNEKIESAMDEEMIESGSKMEAMGKIEAMEAMEKAGNVADVSHHE